jgi:hypothetical protein
VADPVGALGHWTAVGVAATLRGTVAVTWARRVVAGLGVLVVLWCLATAWPAIVHGNPAYAVLLVVTLAVSLVSLARSRAPRPVRSRLRSVVGVGVLLLAVGWIALMAWLRPFDAQEPALTAMQSDAAVTVDESPTQFTMTPMGKVSSLGVFFQPGAKVEARAYAAILRPLAEAGYTVVVAKQPLGIAFLAIGAFGTAQAANPQITRWVVGGHSLGGTIAAMEADQHDTDAVGPVTGLLFYASYPASDLSSSLTASVHSIWATHDGLATPSAIEASRADLPSSATFTAIVGGVHAFFGDYGPQPGDGTPTITHDDARAQTSRDSIAFLARLSR